MKPSDLLGAWTFIGCTRFTENAPPDHPLGAHPTGLILYTPDGMMAAFVQRDPALPGEGPPLAAYAGRWEMEGDMVRHHVQFNTEADRTGQTLIRRARFEGKTLVLQTEKKAGKRGLSWMDFAWQRA